MKNKLFAAALAALTLATAGVASAQDYRRGDNDRHSEYRGDRSLERTIHSLAFARPFGRALYATTDAGVFALALPSQP